MVHAFVFVDCAAGTAESVAGQVRTVENVVETHLVAGDFDLVAELTTGEVHDVLSTVTREIRSLDGVGTTRTYVALE